MNPLTNPLLSKLKLPGRIFQLPSKGLLYPDGILAAHAKKGEVQVKPMSALSELKVRSPDLLYSGRVLKEVCEECVPDILKPEELIDKDVDALFAFLVISTYGPIKRVRDIHDCEKGEWHDHEVNLEELIGNPRNECLNNYEALYTCPLPNGQVVKLKPMNFGRTIELVHTRQDLIKKEMDKREITMDEKERLLIEDVLSVIAAVEDTVTGHAEKVVVTNQDHLTEWVRHLPKTYLDKIVAASEQANDWGFSWKTQLTCPDCQAKFEHDLELNPVNFFSG